MQTRINAFLEDYAFWVKHKKYSYHLVFKRDLSIVDNLKQWCRHSVKLHPADIDETINFWKVRYPVDQPSISMV